MPASSRVTYSPKIGDGIAATDNKKATAAVRKQRGGMRERRRGGRGPGRQRRQRKARKHMASRLLRCAGGKAEGSDARNPIAIAVGGKIFGGIPEGAIIGRIDGEGGIIAPAVAAGFRAGAGGDHGFGIEGAEWV